VLDRDLLLDVFLPLLLFEAALHVDLAVLRDTWLPIALLAVPGVIVSTLVIAILLQRTIGLELAGAALFGALVSATDPVAVLALFKRLHMPEKLAMVIEGESVVNDATALVLVTLLLPVAQGGGLDAPLIALKFIGVLAGGIIIGGGVGWLGARAVALVHDHLAELTLTALIANSSFLLADHVHASGIIATVPASLVFAAKGRSGLTVAGRDLLTDVWEFAAFVANSLLFLLLGLRVHPGDIFLGGGDVAWAVAATLAARAVVVFGFALLLGLAGRPLMRRYSSIVFWSGLRGALTLVLALSLPADLGGRERLLQLAAGVVLFTLLVQGITIAPLLRRVRSREGWDS
jgi:CPA1 family monovalent cation:H+ antiporter